MGLGGGLTDVLNNIKCFFLAKEKGREERGRGIVLALRHFVSLVLFCLVSVYFYPFFKNFSKTRLTKPKNSLEEI